MNQEKIPEHLYSCFAKIGRPFSYKQGETIYMQGDTAGSLYFIDKGRVRAYYTSGGGKEFTFEVIERGRIFGESSFLSRCAWPVSVQAVTDVQLIACSPQELYQHMDDSKELRNLIFMLLSGTCNHLIKQLRRVTMYDRYQRIASLLLDETKHPSKDRGVTKNSIPYTQEDLAMALGLNRVTVNRVLSQWRDQGIVGLSYGKIEILNREYLKGLFD